MEKQDTDGGIGAEFLRGILSSSILVDPQAVDACSVDM